MSIKVTLNEKAIKELLKSQGVKQELEKVGSQIVGRANAAGAQAFAEYHHGEFPQHPPYRMKINEHGDRNVCIVRTNGKHGEAIENKHHILKKIL